MLGKSLRLSKPVRKIAVLPSASFTKYSLPKADKGLKETDPEMAKLLHAENQRQKEGIILIASENFTSSAVMETVGSPLLNKYSEGYPGRRYYGGCMVIDKIELLCQKRALEAYGANPDEWNVNVQSLSGAPANFAVYTGLVPPGGKLMGLDLTCGGHLSHGFQTPRRKVSATSMFWNTKHYRIDDEGFIDYDGAYELAQEFKPDMII